MANPFHDENGRFCSRDEMLNRIEELGRERKFSEQWTLRDELYAADVKASGAKFGKRKQVAEQAKAVRYRIESPILYHQAAMVTSPVLIENVRRVLEVPADEENPKRAFHAIKELIRSYYSEHPSNGIRGGMGDTAKAAAMILDSFDRSEEVDWNHFNGSNPSHISGYALIKQL